MGPYSPGMNPIENVWHTMKNWAFQHHRELNEMGDSKEAYQALYRAIREAREALDQGKIDDMIGGDGITTLVHCNSSCTLQQPSYARTII